MALRFPSFDLYPPGPGLLARTTKPMCKQHQGLNPEFCVRRSSTLVSELSPGRKMVCRGANNEPFPLQLLLGEPCGGRAGWTRRRSRSPRHSSLFLAASGKTLSNFKADLQANQDFLFYFVFLSYRCFLCPSGKQGNKCSCIPNRFLREKNVTSKNEYTRILM